MKNIPSTLVIAALLIIAAAWPSVQQWSDTQVLHHYLVHTLYLLAGTLIGLQSALWRSESTPLSQAEDEQGVSS